MATIPAASPSRPSMRFTAFTIATTQITVRGTARSEPRTSRPCPGKKKYRSWTPNRTSSPAAMIWPASFTGAAVPRMSSYTPMATTTAHATSTPVGSSEVRNRVRNSAKWSWWATARPTTTARKRARPPMVGVGRGCTLRSEGRSTAPTFSATLRTTGVARNETRKVTPNTTAYGARLTRTRPLAPSAARPGARCPPPSRSDRVHREPGGELGDAAAGGFLAPVVSGRPQDLADDPGDLLHLGLVHAERGRAGRPDADAARGERRQRVERDRVLVERDADVVAGLLGLGAGDVERTEVDEREVRVRPAGDDAEPLFREAGRQGPGRPHDPVRVVGELRRHGLPQRHRLGSDAVFQGAALHHREHGLVDGLGVFGLAEDDGSAGAPEGLVGGERHDVRVRHRRRIRAAGHEPDEVTGVDHHERADLVGDPAERLEVDGPGIRRESGKDDLRAVLDGQVPDPVHVDRLGGRVDLVVHEVEPFPGEVHRGAVGEVAAVREHQAEHLVVRLRLDERAEHGHVRLRAGVGLDIGVLRPEQLLGALDGELL